MAQPVNLEIRAKVQEMYAAGSTQTEISEALGIGLATVNRHIHADDFHGTDKERLLKAKADKAEHDAELSRLEVAEAAGELIQTETVISVLQNLGDKFATFLNGLHSILEEQKVNEVISRAREFSQAVEREGDS